MVARRPLYTVAHNHATSGWTSQTTTEPRSDNRSRISVSRVRRRTQVDGPIDIGIRSSVSKTSHGTSMSLGHEVLRDAQSRRIYHHQGQSYEVTELDLDRDTASPANVSSSLETGDQRTIDDITIRFQNGALADHTPVRSAIVHPLEEHGVVIVSSLSPDALQSIRRFSACWTEKWIGAALYFAVFPEQFDPSLSAYAAALQTAGGTVPMDPWTLSPTR